MTSAYRAINAAKVQAFEDPIVRSPDGFRGGPVLEDAADAPLRHTRDGRPFDSFRAGAEYTARLEGEHVYAGPIHDHFGHFMSEMVHRVLPAKRLGLKGPFLFVTTAGWTPHPTYGDFPGFAKEVLSFLEIGPRDVRVVSENTAVELLHVVEAGSDLGGGPKPGYLDALRPFATRRLDALHGATTRPAKLYVSRSALAPEGSVLGEAYFERLLEREGFAIFRPEEMRFTPQMDHYRKAEIVVFPEGSACHGAELLGAGMMGRTFIIPRREGQTRSFRRVLEPRSVAFEVAEGCAEYLGTASIHPRTGTPLTHVGVSWLDLGAAAAFFRDRGLAALPHLSARDHAEAAEADFRRYLVVQSRRGGWWNEELAARLGAAFAAKMAPLQSPRMPAAGAKAACDGAAL